MLRAQGRRNPRIPPYGEPLWGFEVSLPEALRVEVYKPLIDDALDEVSCLLAKAKGCFLAFSKAEGRAKGVRKA